MKMCEGPGFMRSFGTLAKMMWRPSVTKFAVDRPFVVCDVADVPALQVDDVDVARVIQTTALDG